MGFIPARSTRLERNLVLHKICHTDVCPEIEAFARKSFFMELSGQEILKAPRANSQQADIVLSRAAGTRLPDEPEIFGSQRNQGRNQKTKKQFTAEAFDNSKNPVAYFEGPRSTFREH